MNKYTRLKEDLEETGTGSMKCFGNSMLPLLDNPTTNTYITQKEYKVGDIVFCKVRGRWIDSHLITQVNEKRGYMISNNHGHQNGWTKRVFGLVVKAENENKEVKWFNFTEEKLQKLTETETENED